MNIINSISEKIGNAKELDFGTIFSESFELFKKTWVQGLLLQLFTIIIMLPIIIIFYIPLITMVIEQQESGYTDPEAMNEFFAGMSILYVFVLVVCVFLLGTVSSALTAAFFRIMKKLDFNEEISTSDFFYFLKGPYLVKVFLLMMIMVLIIIPSALLCYIPLIYVCVPLSFIIVFFAFNPDLSIGEILKFSFSLGNKKWLLTFGLLVVMYIGLVIITMFTCGIGQLFLQALLFHPSYLIYKHVVGFGEKSEIDSIGQLPES